MTKKPTVKRRKKVPPLTPDQLQAAIERVKASSISDAGKRHIEAILRTASSPHSESPEVLIKALEIERQIDIKAAEKSVGALFTGVGTRGKAALEAMSDDEWNALIDE